MIGGTTAYHIVCICISRQDSSLSPTTRSCKNAIVLGDTVSSKLVCILEVYLRSYLIHAEAKSRKSLHEVIAKPDPASIHAANKLLYAVFIFACYLEINIDTYRNNALQWVCFTCIAI